MDTKSINDYRLTSMEEPTDEMLSQIMREAAEEATKSNERLPHTCSKTVISPFFLSRMILFIFI